MKFAVVCILFVLSALTYFRLQQQINIESDIISAEKKDQMRNIKMMLQWVMIGLGLLVILCGYDLLYVPGADKYLGSRCKATTCSAGPVIKEISMPTSASTSMADVELLYGLPDF